MKNIEELVKDPEKLPEIISKFAELRGFPQEIIKKTPEIIKKSSDF